jgi:hypothetical protein
MSHDLKWAQTNGWLSPSCILPRMTGEDEERTGEKEKAEIH